MAHPQGWAHHFLSLVAFDPGGDFPHRLVTLDVYDVGIMNDPIHDRIGDSP